jgi:hypothetical protein
MLVGILEVDFEKFQIVLLICNRVVANYGSSNATVKRDQYGFILVNFEHLIPLLEIICISNAHSTIFFADDTNSPRGWKVVLHKEPRGQRSHFTEEGNL